MLFGLNFISLQANYVEGKKKRFWVKGARKNFAGPNLRILYICIDYIIFYIYIYIGFLTIYSLETWAICIDPSAKHGIVNTASGVEFLKHWQDVKKYLLHLFKKIFIYFIILFYNLLNILVFIFTQKSLK